VKNLNDYCTLGRTGLKVSPLGLGVMTYGWGADKKAAREIRNSIIFLNQQCKR
jgi:aryl-alcohol dehydrogenase-like predicted oxidoreductase